MYVGIGNATVLRYYGATMDLEKLNTSQIVLLTMLVSFVTSMATGIVTVSLMEEAPTDVTRVVQRVVERTVEQVAPESQQATVVTTERTIIVRETDLIAAAIADNTAKVVRVLGEDGVFVALGIIVGNGTLVAVDASGLVENGAYVVDTGGEADVQVSIRTAAGARGVALLGTSEEERLGESVTLADVGVSLGQTVVVFVEGGGIAQGIVTELGEGGVIGTSIDPFKIARGAPLINIDGDIVGISTGVSREADTAAFIPARVISAQLTSRAEGGTESSDETATSTEESALEVAQ